MPGKANTPVVSVCVLRDRPVAGFVMVTFAPGNAAFCASTTLPCKVAVPLCARAVCAARHKTAAISHVTQCCLLIVSPPKYKNAIACAIASSNVHFEGILADAVGRRGPGR